MKESQALKKEKKKKFNPRPLHFLAGSLFYREEKKLRQITSFIPLSFHFLSLSKNNSIFPASLSNLL